MENASEIFTKSVLISIGWLRSEPDAGASLNALAGLVKEFPGLESEHEKLLRDLIIHKYGEVARVLTALQPLKY
ncbi:MAG: hypothetical protein ACYC3O_07680 [Burkholderiales bacterium]